MKLKPAMPNKWLLVKTHAALTLIMISGEEMDKNRSKEYLHDWTASRRSSYAAEMKKLEKHSSSDFTSREDQHKDTRTRQSRSQLRKSYRDHAITHQRHRCHTSLHTELSHRRLFTCQPRCRESPASGKHVGNHHIQDDACGRKAMLTNAIVGSCTARSRLSPEDVVRG
jgi:hypothetical protein